MPSPKAFSGLLKGEPFDWRAFAANLPWQPVPQWLLFSALAYPFSRAFPVLSRASCPGEARVMLSKVALVAYTMFVPALLTLLVYLFAGRRRMTVRNHRLIANVTLALLVVMTVVDALVVSRAVSSQWETLGPSLGLLRGACWPPKP